jgi:hypothetical protein
LICTWPLEVSEGAPKFWLEPLFGHTIARPPEAAEMFCAMKGANKLWPDRLSSSTNNALPPELLLEELEELDELELLEELDELELLLDEDELPGSGAGGQPPMTGVPSQLALPVAQSSVQSFSRASTIKP